MFSLNLLGSSKDIKSENTKPSTEELHISTSEALTAEHQTYHHHQPSISLALPLHTSPHLQVEVPDDDLTPTEGGNFSTCDAIQQSCLTAEVQPWFKGLLTMDDFKIMDEHRSV